MHKTDKHSNADCRAQKETSPSSTATVSKKCPKGSERRKAKPRKLRFKSTSDKKKFLRSIEDTEGVSLESASSDDEDVVEQSLMQLDPVSGGTTDEEEEGELHILMLDPDSLLDDPDINMDSVFLDPGASTEALDSGVSGIRLEGEKADSPMSMKAGCSSSGFSPLDTALLNTSMNTPVVPIPTVKDEKNPFSPEQYPQVEEEMFPPLASNVIHPEASAVESLPNQNYLLFGGVYYQPVPPPHVVVTHSTVPRPDLVPVGPVPSVDFPVAASEIPLPATAMDTETNASDLSVPLTEAPSASAATDDTAVKLPSNPQTKEDKEFAVPKEPSFSGSTKTRRKARPRSRSSSSRNSEPSQARRPQGVTPSDSLTNAKRVCGVGRGKAKEAANAMPMSSPNLLTGAVAPENIRITVPAGAGSRKIEIIPDYPANIAHLAKLEDDT